ATTVWPKRSSAGTAGRGRSWSDWAARASPIVGPALDVALAPAQRDLLVEHRRLRWRAIRWRSCSEHVVSRVPRRHEGGIMRFIPTKVHGILDYVVGAALIVAPWLFGYAGVGGAAVIIP